jgi:hypothetical protein
MTMRPKLALLVCVLLPCSAFAGVYGDEMSKCLIESTTKDDRGALVRWLFTAAATNPAIAPIAVPTKDDLDNANKTMGALMMRLLTDSCKDQTIKALRYEGSTTWETSFGVLFQVAGHELVSGREVTQALSGLKDYLDPKKLQALNEAP